MRPKMRRTQPPRQSQDIGTPVNNPLLMHNVMEAYNKQRNWFAVNKTVSRAIGGLQSHIFGYYVDQFMYWLEREPKFNGWFYRTHEDVAEELNFPVNTIRRVKQDLIRLGLLKSQMGGLPIKEWLTVDMSKLDELIRPYVEDAIGSRRQDYELEGK